MPFFWSKKSGKKGREKGVQTKKARTPNSNVHQVHLGGNYSDEQEEWLKAVHKFLSVHRRYPTMQETLAIALALGYRKTDGHATQEDQK